MLALIAKRAIGAFERRWNYDMTYAREVLDEGGFDAIGPMNALSKIAQYRRDVPLALYHAVKITTAIAADCGPCAQLHVSMAEADGLDAATLRAIVSEDVPALPADAALGVAFAKACLAREDATELRETIVRRWGRPALASLGYAMVAAQAYPTLKVALGYAHACVRLRIGDVDIAVREPSLA